MTRCVSSLYRGRRHRLPAVDGADGEEEAPVLGVELAAEVAPDRAAALDRPRRAELPRDPDLERAVVLVVERRRERLRVDHDADGQAVGVVVELERRERRAIESPRQ